MVNIFNCDLFHSEETEEEIEARQESELIDLELAEERLLLQRMVKILVLGAEESGKTTLCTAMRIIHEGSFSLFELARYRNTIFKNILDSMKTLIHGRVEFGISWGLPVNEDNAQMILRVDSSRFCPRYFRKLIYCIKSLWRDEGIQEVFKRRTEICLAESVKYFFDKVENYNDSQYLPSNLDVLHIHRPTRKLEEYKLNIGNVPFLFIEPSSSQQNGRYKWLKYFENVFAVFFFVATSEYDQNSNSTPGINRITEALGSLQTIINHWSFRNTPIVLLLNKTDLLQAKCKKLNQIWEGREKAEVRRGNEQLRDELTRDLASVSAQEKGKLFRGRCRKDTPSTLDQSLPVDVEKYYYCDRDVQKRYSLEGIKTYKDYFRTFSANPFDIVKIQIHMMKMFKLCRVERAKGMWVHVTSAVDTASVARAWKFVQGIIQKNIDAININ